MASKSLSLTVVPTLPIVKDNAIPLLLPYLYKLWGRTGGWGGMWMYFGAVGGVDLPGACA